MRFLFYQILFTLSLSDTCNNIEPSPEIGKIGELTVKELAEDCVDLIIKSLVSLVKEFLVKEFRILYMHQKYSIVFSSNTNLVFIVTLKIAGISIEPDSHL